MTESVGNAGYTDVDRTADPSDFVRHIDMMTGKERVQASKRRTFELLELCAGSSVLDVGCGTGDDVLALAELVGPDGRVVGVDRSLAMIEEARRRADGLRLPVEFQVGDAGALDFPDGSFDGCHMDRVLHHLDEPQPAVSELVRVARTGGRVVMHEPDFELLALDSPDRRLTRKLVNFFCDGMRNGWAGRQVYGLAKRAGLADVSAEISTWMSTDYVEVDQMMRLETIVAHATETGVVTAAEGADWLAGLQAAGAAGTFYWASMVVMVSGRKVTL